ncbi:MAG: penicillin-binding protein, partial [Cytophagales bacterium]|nr:penicillin-binding protein [Cytophagales bacterium]
MQKFWSIVIKITWIGFLSGIFLLFSYVWAVKNDFLGLFGGMPPLAALENPKSELASELYSSDYVLLGKYFRYNRTPVTYEEISPNLINALLATEDIRFEEHSGIDFKGTFAIFWYLLKGDNRGSSTITQQLAKNLFETRGNAYKGTLSDVKGLGKLIVKTKEWITAIKLESAYTKKEIMTMYFNTVDFGSNAYGIQVAAKTFFDTTPAKLTVPEAAVLVGLLKAPTMYSPILNPENSLNRRNTVLEQMYKYKFLGKEELLSYKSKPIELKYKVDNHNTGLATYFRSEILDFLLKWSKENGYDLFSDGLKIYATIDSRVQKYAEEAMEKHMRFIQARFYEALHGGPAWVDENMKELPGFIENVAKRTERYKLLNKRYNGNLDSINFYMNK